jgi:uncharacterized protein YuzE
MIVLSTHAREAVEKRNVALDWIERALALPDFTHPDPDPALMRSFKAIEEADGRILRVVHSSRRRGHSDRHRPFRQRCQAMMRTSYDPEVDAMFIWFGPEGVKSIETEEVAPGVMLDFDEKGQVIGIEVLGVSQRMSTAKAAAE